MDPTVRRERESENCGVLDEILMMVLALEMCKREESKWLGFGVLDQAVVRR